jgi:hypothetical protein
MASPDTKPQQIAEPASDNPAASDAFRVKSIATRLTEAEIGEIEAAAFKAGKKVSESRCCSRRSFHRHPTD